MSKRNKNLGWLSLWYKIIFVHRVFLLPFLFLKLNEINSFIIKAIIKNKKINKTPIYKNKYIFLLKILINIFLKIYVRLKVEFVLCENELVENEFLNKQVNLNTIRTSTCGRNCIQDFFHGST